MEESKQLLVELLKEHPVYTSFIFASFEEGFEGQKNIHKEFERRCQVLKNVFLEMDDRELLSFPAVILTKVRLLTQRGKAKEALKIMKNFMALRQGPSEVMKTEYIKLLLQEGEIEEAVKGAQEFFDNMHQKLTKHFCHHCGYNSDKIFWCCPQCHRWETIEFRWKV